jgi:probable HAF family extracellular repeat protein
MRNTLSKKWSRRTHFGSISPRTRGTLLAIAFAAFIGLISPSELHAHRYKVIFLGTFGGDQTVATAINDLNEVVGYSQLPGNTGAQHPFLYRHGNLTDLDPDPNEVASDAQGINHYGQVVGETDFLGVTHPVTHACVYQRGTIIDMGTLAGPTGASFACGINDSGEIVGASTIANGNFVPFLYRNGVMSELGTNFTGTALAINNLGQIVGVGMTQSGAFLYQNGSFIDLGTLGGTDPPFAATDALAINNRGQIVGFSHLPNHGHTHAFLYENGAMKDLGGNSSVARGINDKSEVVGQDIDKNGLPFAFLYTQQSGLVNLNNYVINLSNGTTTGFTSVANAFAINEQGNIAGLGNYFNGTKTIQAGFLLKRIDNDKR